MVANGQLFEHPDILPAVAEGKLAAGEMLVSVGGRDNPLFSADAIPFLVHSYEESADLYRVVRPYLSRFLRERGLVLLYSVPWPPQGLYLRSPIHSTDQLRGKLLRSYNQSTERLIRLLGAEPRLVEYRALTSTLKEVPLDGIFSAASTGIDLKLWEHFSYFYDLQACLPRNMVVVNAEAFARLPEQIRDTLMSEALKAEERGIRISRQQHRRYKRMLEERGIRVLLPPVGLREEFAMAGSALLSRWIRETGADGAQLIGDYVR